MVKRNEDKPENWSDIVGQPDDWDKKNLSNLISKFKKTTFYFTAEDGKKYGVKGAEWIKNEVQDAKDSHQLKGVGEIINPYGVKSQESDMRVATAIPIALWQMIEESYPTMFRDRKHFDWFLKNFKEFRVPSKW